MPAANGAALLRRNAERFGDRPAIRFGEQMWTHADYFTESCRFARLFQDRRPDGPFHVGVLLDNTPDYLFALGAAASLAQRSSVSTPPGRESTWPVMPSTPMSACCSPSRAISTSSSPFVPDGASTTIASSCRSASTIPRTATA